ncbi:hypothetical protein PPACK8108_LOCUS5933 [Phakopsora pachyrhizi]|uniref:Probable 26S proteasome regulatory subunit p27 n=1 Tax=Phakopsora pachyrhizi TaxID=170000 RepID=A0AAV0AR68_PHAPC|nr:hypothetical protein PPACK8108_LOCUS5933 [Phakopsora pachyrhizi]
MCTENDDEDVLKRKDRFESLNQRKLEIEREISDEYDFLRSDGIDLKESLIDSQGFPRNDTVSDLTTIRLSRVKLIRLKNDLRSTMDEISSILQLIIPPSQSNLNSSSSSSGLAVGVGLSKESNFRPFARVDVVFEGSPAEMTGLMVGDQIVRFGELNAENHDRLGRLSKLVEENLDRELRLVWIRLDEDGRRKILSKGLIPRSGWGGRGLIGCHVVPI